MTDDKPYLLITVFLIAACAFAVTPLLAAWVWARLFSPRKPGPEKNAIYECGLESKGDAWVQFSPSITCMRIIFLIFDVETIFLLPFAVAFTGLPVGAFRGHDGFSVAAGGRPGVGLAEGILTGHDAELPP